MRKDRGAVNKLATSKDYYLGENSKYTRNIAGLYSSQIEILLVMYSNYELLICNTIIKHLYHYGLWVDSMISTMENTQIMNFGLLIS